MARILITGSNSGFGKLTALSLARQGHEVIATMRNLAKGLGLSAACEAEGMSVEIRPLDVCDPASVDAALADAASIDVLINNAGYEVQAGVTQISDEAMAHQLDTNVLGPLRTMRAVLPTWTKRGSGVVVNVSSIAGRVASPYSGAYAASKHALEALTEAAHLENSQLGIRFHLIEPGRFDTDFRGNIVRPDVWEGSAEQARAESFREALTGLDGDGPPSDPQSVADAIVRAATDPTMPLRTLVGDDAVLIDGAKTSLSFEDFETTMRTTLNWHD